MSNLTFIIGRIAARTAVKLSTCGYWKGDLLQSAELLGKLMGSRFSALPS